MTDVAERLRAAVKRAVARTTANGMMLKPGEFYDSFAALCSTLERSAHTTPEQALGLDETETRRQ